MLIFVAGELDKQIGVQAKRTGSAAEYRSCRSNGTALLAMTDKLHFIKSALAAAAAVLPKPTVVTSGLVTMAVAKENLEYSYLVSSSTG